MPEHEGCRFGDVQICPMMASLIVEKSIYNFAYAELRHCLSPYNPRMSTGPTRSLPEHTVDCWVAAAIITYYPDAFVWAPTQLGDDNWDVAFGSEPGKTFILEDKATIPGYTDDKDDHHVQINIEQLENYSTYPVPVYYVIPDPPWPATSTAGTLAPTAPVPNEAGCRNVHVDHPAFIDWARVIEAADLNNMHPAFERRPGVLATSTKPKRVPIRLNITPRSITLRRFLNGIAECTHGGQRYKTGDRARAKAIAQLEARRRNSEVEVRKKGGGGTLAVFIPMPFGP